MYNSEVQYIEQLGSGGFGEVHRALVTGIQGEVAVKELTNPSKEGIARFKREVLISSRLKHENIMPVLKHSLENSPYWFAMPLASESLMDGLGYYRFDLAKLHDIFLQILKGMTHAHTQGIIHRDLKPQNILIKGDKVRVSDFGLGKRIDKTELYTTFTQTGMRGGTIVYASPEQMRDLKQADKRSDIFALGKLLYHMLTDEEPFPDMDMNLIDDKYKFIINKCTQRNPDERFQTIADLMGSFSLLSDELAFGRIKKADESMAEAFLKPIDIYAINEIHEIFASHQSDYDLFTDYFPKLGEDYLVIYINQKSSSFRDILKIYDNHVSGDLSFGYCDIVANMYKKILNLTDDLDVWRLVLTRILLMGVSHNRFHVMDVLYRVLCNIKDMSKALVAKDVLENNPADTAYWKGRYGDLDGEMLKLLVDVINNTDFDNNPQELDDILF